MPANIGKVNPSKDRFFQK